MKFSEKVRKELSTAFNDPQVVSVAITADGSAFMAIDFNRYGLNEIGIYSLSDNGIKPLYIAKKMPRIWYRDRLMKEMVKKSGATLIKNAQAMDKFLADTPIGRKTA